MLKLYQLLTIINRANSVPQKPYVASSVVPSGCIYHVDNARLVKE